MPTRSQWTLPNLMNTSTVSECLMQVHAQPAAISTIAPFSDDTTSASMNLQQLLVPYRSQLRDACIYDNIASIANILDEAEKDPLISNLPSVQSIRQELINAPLHVNGTPPLHWAAINGHVNVVVYLIDKCGAQVDCQTGEQHATAALWAARRGHVNVMHALGVRGADLVNVRDKDGSSALHLCALSGSPFACLYLVSGAGLHPNVVDALGRTPLHMAVIGDTSNQELIKTSAWVAIAASTCATLLALGANPSPNVSGYPLLHWALEARRQVIIELLIAYGADVDAVGVSGKSSVELAQELGFSQKWINDNLRFTSESDHEPEQDEPKNTPSPRRSIVQPFKHVPAAMTRALRRVARLVRSSQNSSTICVNWCLFFYPRKTWQSKYTRKRQLVDLLFAILPCVQFGVFVLMAPFWAWWITLGGGIVVSVSIQLISVKLLLDSKSNWEDMGEDSQEQNLIGKAAWVGRRLRASRGTLMQTPYLASIIGWTLVYALFMWLIRFLPSTGLMNAGYHIVWACLWVATCYCLYCTVLGDPGYLPREAIRPSWPPNPKRANEGAFEIQVEHSVNGSHVLELAEHDKLNKQYFCLTCMIRRPMRSKHCKICDRCISCFDHHCPWTWNCIGGRNHRFFIMFLVLMQLLTVINSSLWADSADARLEASKHLQKEAVEACAGFGLCERFYAEPIASFLVAFTWLQMCWVILLTIQQMYQVTINSTTNEWLNWYKYDHTSIPNGAPEIGGYRSTRTRTPHSSLDRGVVQNCLEFCRNRRASNYGIPARGNYQTPTWTRWFAPSNRHGAHDFEPISTNRAMGDVLTI